MSTIEHEMQRYLDQHGARSPNTARTYRNGLKRFEAYLAEREISLEDEPDKLTAQVARDFVTWLGRQTYRKSDRSPERPLAMRTRQNYVMAVSGLYRQLVMEGTLNMTFGDYMALREWMSKATKWTDEPLEKKLPPDAAIEAIIEAIQNPPDFSVMKPRTARREHLIWLRDRAIIFCLHSTGMRVGELVGLRRRDLDYDDQGAWVSGKGDRERFVRFSSRAWKALMDYLEARADNVLPGSLADRPLFARHDRSAGDFRCLPLSTVTVEKMITQLARDASVLERFNLTPHSFRHWFATKFLRHTGDLALTQDVMGHASPQTTRIYAKTTKEDHIAAHESLFDEE